MAFWGIEVKPGHPYTFFSKNAKGRLHLSQATLGIGSATNKSIVQCNVGDRYPVFLCALLPGNSESCSLALEFEEAQDVVFSVIGPRSVHLTGYYMSSCPQLGRDEESESYGEDIAHSENEEDHCSEDDDYDDSFIDDGDALDVEIEKNAESKPKKGKGHRRLKKKLVADVYEDSDSPQPEKRVSRRTRSLIVESDDEDSVPIPSLKKSLINEVSGKMQAEGKQDKDKIKTSEDKEKVKMVSNGSLAGDQQGRSFISLNSKGIDLKRPLSPSPNETESEKGPKTKKKKKEQKVGESEGIDLKKGGDMDTEAELKVDSKLQHQSPNNAVQLEITTKKTKKKKSKTQQDGDVTIPCPLGEHKNVAAPTEVSSTVSNANSQIRTLSNGMTIEELEEGGPDGKVASKGKKIKIIYVGKLKNGQVFDSNTDATPYKFRLGAGKVIDGWDIGIEGMKVGGKRRLTIPPILGFGSKGNGENIPPNSWLIYDIELVSAR